MLKRLFRRSPAALKSNVEGEILSICHTEQVRRLSLSPHLQRDIGLDCGCSGPMRLR